MNTMIKRMKLGLQYFAEPNQGTPPAALDPQPATAPQPQPQAPTPTKTNYEDLIGTDRELQAFVDSKITKATATAVQNALEKERKLRDATVSEAERLAAMTETERLKYEISKMNKEKSTLESKLNARNLRDETALQAKTLGLDSELLQVLDFERETAETVNTKLTTLKSVFDTAVEKALSQKLSQSPPKTVTQGGKAYTLDDISKMSASEINKNWDAVKGVL